MPKLFQINVCLTASTGKIANAIGDRAMDAGWESWIGYSAHEPTAATQSHIYRIGSKPSTWEHVAETRLFDDHGLASRRATHRLVEQLRREAPDIIHLHNIHGYYLNYRILFDYLNSIDTPIVWTLHDCWSFTGHCAHFVTAGCDRWRTGCHSCPLKHDYPKSFADRSKRNYLLKRDLFGKNQNLHIVCVSNWLASFAKESFFSGKDIRVINNGIDLNVFRPLPTVPHQRFRILGVSNVWYEAKGIYDFYKLRDLLPSDEFEIVLVGLTDRQIKALPSGITGIGRTKSVEELVSLYSGADVFVNPTYADSFPTVNIESLACGTPVVTYRTGGSPEIIDEKTGMVVPQGDIDSLVLAIKAMRDRADSTVRSECRARAEALFDKNSRYSEYLALYEELVH